MMASSSTSLNVDIQVCSTEQIKAMMATTWLGPATAGRCVPSRRLIGKSYSVVAACGGRRKSWDGVPRTETEKGDEGDEGEAQRGRELVP